MCDEVEEGWWSLDNLSSKPEIMPWQDLGDWDLASEADLAASGWDTDRFQLQERWWDGGHDER